MNFLVNFFLSVRDMLSARNFHNSLILLEIENLSLFLALTIQQETLTGAIAI